MMRYSKKLTKLLLPAAALTSVALISTLTAEHNDAGTVASAAASAASSEATAAANGASTDVKPTYTVISCNDGDTCRLRSTDNTQLKIRLVGIDAPETGKKTGKKKKEGQAGSLEAKDFLNNLLAGKSVTLRSYGMDPYGRNLAEIILNNESANVKMIAEGWAEIYRGKTPRGLDLKPFENAQIEAKKNSKGIWSLQNYESPQDFRKRHRD